LNERERDRARRAGEGAEIGVKQSIVRCRERLGFERDGLRMGRQRAGLRVSGRKKMCRVRISKK
jgi:hypothetical protein